MKVKVLPIEYEIIREKEDQVAGCDIINNQITLDPRLKDKQLEVALWHEILHVSNSSIDETTVESIAQTVVSVLYDNPHIFRYKGINKLAFYLSKTGFQDEEIKELCKKNEKEIEKIHKEFNI